MTSPTARSLEFLRKSGCIACVVERWIPKANIRKDAFGIGDILAARRGEPGALLVQSTTRANLAARVAKAKQCGELKTWLAAPGNRFECHGWECRAGRWKCHRVELKGEDLAAVVIEGQKRRPRRAKQRELF